jgi:hypothetical protein
LDHVIGPMQESRGNVEVRSLRRPRVDYKFKMGGLFYRDVAWFGAIQNLVDVGSGLGPQPLTAISATRNARRSIANYSVDLREMP